MKLENCFFGAVTLANNVDKMLILITIIDMITDLIENVSF